MIQTTSLDRLLRQSESKNVRPDYCLRNQYNQYCNLKFVLNFKNRVLECCPMGKMMGLRSNDRQSTRTGWCQPRRSFKSRIPYLSLSLPSVMPTQQTRPARPASPDAALSERRKLKEPGDTDCLVLEGSAVFKDLRLPVHYQPTTLAISLPIRFALALIALPPFDMADCKFDNPDPTLRITLDTCAAVAPAPFRRALAIRFASEVTDFNPLATSV